MKKEKIDTVTIPLEKYEKMKEKIEALEADKLILLYVGFFGSRYEYPGKYQFIEELTIRVNKVNGDIERIKGMSLFDRIFRWDRI